MPSPAAQLLNASNNYGGADLAQRRSDEIAEIERQRRLAAKMSFSPAGAASLGLLSQGMQ
ncbi:MAG: hypothetical protein ABI407_11455 [Bradyrhizobium sp.]